MASTDAVVTFSVWLSDIAESSNFFSHGVFNFIFGDDLSVHVKTSLVDKQVLVPFTSDAVFVDSFEFVLDNWDDSVDVKLALDHGIQSFDVFGFDVGVWVRVTVGDDDNNLFSARFFCGLNLTEKLLETDVQERTFVESFEGVQFGRESTIRQVFVQVDIVVGSLGVSHDSKSGIDSHFVVIVDVSSNKINSEFHFVPGVSDARRGIEENKVVGFAGFVFWWLAVTFAVAVGSAKLGWCKSECAGNERRQQYQ